MTRAHGILVAIGLLALAAGYQLHRTNSGPKTVPVADISPPALMTTALPDLDGDTRRLADWRGKVLVVNFWATWCAPCREEMPVLIRTQDEHAAHGVQVIGIALDEVARAKAFSAEIGVNYPVLVAGMEGLKMLSVAGNEQGLLPYTLFVDRAGNITKANLGQVTEDSMRKALAAIL